MSDCAVAALERPRHHQGADALNDLLIPKEVAQLRRCSIRKLEEERANGRGPAYIRDGRMIFYRRRDIYAYMEANLRGGEIASPARRGRPRKVSASATAESSV